MDKIVSNAIMTLEDIYFELSDLARDWPRHGHMSRIELDAHAKCAADRLKRFYTWRNKRYGMTGGLL